MIASERIAETLKRRFSPAHLKVADVSHTHAGHAGALPGGETHFRVDITADAFAGMTRVARHRAVMAALASEFADRLHALEITARAPGE